ncbi:hypothetical protein Q7P35_000919 [Cladosporium inversicolor]
MSSKASAEHNEGLLEPELKPEHEALLPGVMALANLFSNTVEAFGLIRASQRWEREEQLLLSRLGIQQARLLIWGDILGVSSPPSSVTNQAVPKHPSAAYPDLKEPTFFAPRDARLDEPDTRQQIEDALSSIVDRSAHTTRDEMMEKFGLKPPKRFTPDYQPALDTTRLEAFREKYELLKEVAESYARINSRRTNSIVMQSWTISDRTKFASFIHLTQEKIDFLVNSMGVGERIDRAMRMDIRNFGWHITADRARIAQDVSKLKLIHDACKDDYPQYIIAVTQALDNISRESRENSGLGSTFSYNPYAAPTTPRPESKRTASNGNGATNANGAGNGQSNTKPHTKRPGMFSRFLSFRNKSKEEVPKSKAHQQQGHSQKQEPSSQPATIEPTADPDRSLSDAGPQTGLAPPSDELERVRSRSLDAGVAPAFSSSSAAASSSTAPTSAPAVSNLDEQVLQDKLERLDTKDTVHLPLEHTETVQSMISRHDQAYRVQ